MSRIPRSFPLLLLAIALTACASDDTAAPAVDAGAIDGTSIDGDGCDVAALLPANYRPIAMVSTGTVMVAASGGVTAGTLDATAGGTAAAAEQPYLYVDLLTGRRVDITDVAALSSTAWHVALKRSNIRINGGDSGPGAVTAARVEATTLAEVTTAPAALATDDWAAPDCTLRTLPGGEPATTLGDWYDYDPGTHTLTPKPEVWVIRIGATATVKLRITSYYGDTASPMRGAYYRVEWAPL